MSSTWLGGGWLKKLSSQWLSVAVGALISLFLTPLVARGLGSLEYGKYSLVLTLVALFGLLLDFGGRIAIFRHGVANDSEYLQGFSLNQIICHSLSHSLIISIGLVTIFLIFGGAQASILLASVFSATTFTLVSLSGAKVKSAGLFSLEARWQIQVQIISGLGTVVALFLTGDAIACVVASAIFTFVLWTVVGYDLLKINRFFFRISSACYRATLPLASIEIATTIAMRADLPLIALLGYQADMGKYAAAKKIVDLVMLAFAPLASIFFHNFRSLIRASDRSVGLVFKRALLYSAAFGIVQFLAAFFLGDLIVLLLYGEDFSGASEYFLPFSAVLFFLILNYVVTQVSIALDLDRYYAGCVVFVAIATLLVMCVFVFFYGALGAIYSLFLGQVFLFLSLALKIFPILERGNNV